MGKRGTVVSCIASLGLLALGATLGARRVRRRQAHRNSGTGGNSAHPTHASASNNPPEAGRNCSCSACRSASAAQDRQERENIWKVSCDVRHKSSCKMGETGSCSCNAPVIGARSAGPGATAGLSAAAFDCPVCLGEFVLPRVAMCGHTICTSCILALFEHERRPMCPVCRRRIRTTVSRLPINFLIQACVEERVAQRGPNALAAYRTSEDIARALVGGTLPSDDATASGGNARSGADSPSRELGNNGVVIGAQSIAMRLRPAWNWFKWTVIIVTEFGAFLVSLKEVLDAGPARTRRYQRIV